MFKMRKLIFAALLTAPVLALNSTPAAACGWYGYGYNAYCAPSYSYAPGAYYGYAPAYNYGYGPYTYGYAYNYGYAPAYYGYAPAYNNGYGPYTYGYAPAYRYYRTGAYYGRSIYRRGVVRSAAWRAGRRW
jgi:hypothetical protein